MVETDKLRFRKGDWIVIGLVILLAVCVVFCFLPQGNRQAGHAQIYLNGQLLKTVALDEEQTFAVTDRYTNVITVEDFTIAITSSDCPGQDCVHSGRISSTGRIIVCLPNGLEIRVISDTADVDFVVG